MAKRERKLWRKGSLNGGEGTVRTPASSDVREDRDSVHEHIRMRAYELYMERGAQPDDSLNEWLEAEREFQRSPYEGILDPELVAH